MKLESFLDVPDSPRFYALFAVLLLELLAMGPLRNYVDRPETLPPTVVPCRHSKILSEFGSNVVVPNGLEDWFKDTNSFGYWISTNNRIVQLPNGKYQPQSLVPTNFVDSSGVTNSGGWIPLFVDASAYDELWLAQMKLRNAWIIKKEVTDAMVQGLKQAFKTP